VQEAGCATRLSTYSGKEINLCPAENLALISDRSASILVTKNSDETAIQAACNVEA